MLVSWKVCSLVPDPSSRRKENAKKEEEGSGQMANYFAQTIPPPFFVFYFPREDGLGTQTRRSGKEATTGVNTWCMTFCCSSLL